MLLCNFTTISDANFQTLQAKRSRLNWNYTTTELDNDWIILYGNNTWARWIEQAKTSQNRKKIVQKKKECQAENTGLYNKICAIVRMSLCPLTLAQVSEVNLIMRKEGGALFEIAAGMRTSSEISHNSRARELTFAKCTHIMVKPGNWPW